MRKQRTVNRILPDLAHFTGTTRYYGLTLGYHAPTMLILTDGTQYVMDKANAYWLATDIALHAPAWLAKGDGFALIEVKVNDDDSAVIDVTDGNDNRIAKLKIAYTDFPRPGIKFYMAWEWQDGANRIPVLYLPSEH